MTLQAQQQPVNVTVTCAVQTKLFDHSFNQKYKNSKVTQKPSTFKLGNTTRTSSLICSHSSTKIKLPSDKCLKSTQVTTSNSSQHRTCVNCVARLSTQTRHLIITWQLLTYAGGVGKNCIFQTAEKSLAQMPYR